VNEFLGEAHAGCHSYRTNIVSTWLPNLRYWRCVSDVTASVSVGSTVTICRHVRRCLEVVDSWNKFYMRLLCALSVVFYIPVIFLTLRL
jgi:hypothetical protein